MAKSIQDVQSEAGSWVRHLTGNPPHRVEVGQDRPGQFIVFASSPNWVRVWKYLDKSHPDVPEKALPIFCLYPVGAKIGKELAQIQKMLGDETKPDRGRQ